MHLHHHNDQRPLGQPMPVNMMQQPQPNQQPYYQPPPFQQPQYGNTYPPAPAQNYQQTPMAGPPSHYTMAQPNYHPRVGFTHLPPRFHVWITMSRAGTSVLNLGAQPNGSVAYSAKMGSATRLKIHDGSYNSSTSAMPVCNIESKNMFSSTTTISFANFSSSFKEVTMFHEGVAWPFEVDVNGSKQTWQWQRSSSSSTMKHVISFISQSSFGRWELVPASGGNGNPAAVFEPAGGNMLKKDSDLGVFAFSGPAAEGQLGDVFMNVAVAVLLRIMSQHYIARIASLAS
ncbi:hypothetical protein IQ06DRAFT_293816 [Phaeosphaeriaceae sp. SRC1lsM3a]|nr:hypothetical protein IQ06DRAFT_293816 [Stagonospora sp. SRC1lsM3a]